MKKILFLLACASLLFSCGDSTRIAKLAKIDIVGANTLYVAPSGVTSRGGESIDTLYKIGESGVPEQVPFLDEDGNEIILTDTDVEYVINAHEDFTVVGYRDTARSRAGYDSLAVMVTNKITGAVFSLENAGFPTSFSRDYKDLPEIRHSKDSLFFFCERWNSDTEVTEYPVIKLNLIPIASMTAKDIKLPSDSSSTIYNFEADMDGNVVYGGGGGTDCRLIKASGGFANLPSEISFVAFGKMFLWNEGLKAISVTDSGVLEYIDYTTPDSINSFRSDFTTVLEKGNKTFLLETFDSICTIYEISEATKSVTLATDSLNTVFKSIAQSAESDNFFYVLGADSNANPKMVRMDLSTFAFKELDISKYDIKSFSPSDDYIDFSGNEFATGDRVVARMNCATGVVEVQQRNSASDEVIILERVN